MAERVNAIENPIKGFQSSFENFSKNVNKTINQFRIGDQEKKGGPGDVAGAVALFNPPVTNGVGFGPDSCDTGNNISLAA